MSENLPPTGTVGCKGKAGRTGSPREQRARARARDGGPGDRGSIAPLILGLMGALLLLSVGVIAGGSAFLANQRLQGLCDGAVAAAVGALDPRRTSAAGTSNGDALAAADEYLAVRGPDVTASVRIGARSVSATCRNTAPVALGAVFGTPTVDQSVTADSEPFQRASAPADTTDPPRPTVGSFV